MKELSQPVTSSGALSGLCAEVAGEPYIAVDTEFTRRRTYRPKLELIQIATDDVIFCVDAKSVTDWFELREVFAAPSTALVFHSADQDLEALEQHRLVPNRIIDSQIAAQLCGETKLSYKHLVNEHLGVALPKDQTQTRWSRRPLTSEQIRYALNDVRYILPLYRRLRGQLKQASRLSWLEEECQRLRDLPRGDAMMADAWKSFNGGSMLSISDQQIAKHLLTWREQRASKIDLPRQWVLSDQQITALLKDKPSSVEQTAKRLNVKKSQVPFWVKAVHSILNAHQENADLPVWQTWRALSAAEKRRVEKLLDDLYRIADQANLPGAYLCNRQEAVETVCGSRTARMFSGWRWALAASAIESLLDEED